MSFYLKAIYFLKHRLQALTRHGVHSPRVYAFIDRCLYASVPEVPSLILERYRQLKKDEQELSGMDHGRGQEVKMHVSGIVRASAIPDFQAHLLHRIVAYTEPKRVLELGTNLGKSMACMSSASAEASFTGVEGNEGLAAFASACLKDLGLHNVQVVHATFDAFLNEDEAMYDLVFLDGDHHYEPTMRYFKQLKRRLRAGGMIIFHDIYWSRDMMRAWKEVKLDAEVTVTLDLFFMGIAWLRLPQAKENFILRFPLSLFRVFL